MCKMEDGEEPEGPRDEKEEKQEQKEQKHSQQKKTESKMENKYWRRKTKARSRLERESARDGAQRGM